MINPNDSEDDNYGDNMNYGSNGGDADEDFDVLGGMN